ncbi:MAG: hypothetical protein N2588_12460 [Rhodovarius sp.]|nr:hypothetical protein [Rhodovarius sp.]
MRPAHLRSAEGQAVWIVFSGAGHLPWQRLLAPGFRHCFAALHDAQGWLVLDPLWGRLLLARLEVAPDFDLPGFYLRAGLLPIGPFRPGPPAPFALPLPLTCVSVCRAVLGAGAPLALTPRGLARRLMRRARKMFLTSDFDPVYPGPVNGRSTPTARPAPPAEGTGLFRAITSRSAGPMGSLFSAPKPVRIDPPPPPPAPPAPEPARIAEAARSEARLRLARSRLGTIATSERGVLAALPVGLARKSLLGE